jgi:Uma2 family endonuclease
VSKPTSKELEQLAAMAADPDIQRELRQIDQEFRPTELDGLDGPEGATQDLSTQEDQRMIVLAPPNPICSGPARTATEEQRLLLYKLEWQSYVAISDALLNRPNLRITYDRGNLEIKTTSPEHEKYKMWAGRILETLAEEFGLEIEPAGNSTFRREELERGLEPDNCYWIAHEPQVRGRLVWDPAIDPPPDLVIEIEVSRSALPRMAIYAALGVPEVWRFDGTTLRVELLQPAGSWLESATSPTFPGIPVAGIAPFLQPSTTTSYLATIRAFRAWIQQQRAP